jgi:uncharacterized protein YndB with AHSA1/START domain
MTYTSIADISDRQISASQIVDAPREKVFKAWQDPLMLAKWWGPDGFSLTTSEFNMAPGGSWIFVMHGPDGTDYNNKIVYREIIEPERIAYSHVSGPLFDATATFEDQDGKTWITVCMVFESADLRNRVVEEFGAVDGLQQTLRRLSEQVKG